MLYSLKKYFLEVTGMDDATLQPAAGAAGEWTGMMIMRAYHKEKGELDKRKEKDCVFAKNRLNELEKIDKKESR